MTTAFIEASTRERPLDELVIHLLPDQDHIEGQTKLPEQADRAVTDFLAQIDVLGNDLIAPVPRRRVHLPVGNEHHLECRSLRIFRSHVPRRLDGKEEIRPLACVSIVLGRIDIDFSATAEQDEAMGLSSQKRVNFLDHVPPARIRIERRQARRVVQEEQDDRFVVFGLQARRFLIPRPRRRQKEEEGAGKNRAGSFHVADCDCGSMVTCAPAYRLRTQGESTSEVVSPQTRRVIH